MTASSANQQGTVSPGTEPELRCYDILLVNSSAGKDSQATLDVVVEAARAAGVLDRVVVVHADLGEAEWEGVPELAAEHAAHYGLRFELARREVDGQTYTILDHVQRRGKWPSAQARWCTSDFKRGPIRKVMTKLVAELRESGQVVDRPVKVLNVMGLRAEESSARARRIAYSPNPGASNGRRRVDDWYPLHAWSVVQVWDQPSGIASDAPGFEITTAGTRARTLAAGEPQSGSHLHVCASTCNRCMI